ncbi:NAD(+) synthetase [Streptococcus dysgalactiae subsp. equisimilis RE378]|nr:NAD(+) synthetase [Streptococcus dysgalactiae subsp. equisimilis RE378]
MIKFAKMLMERVSDMTLQEEIIRQLGVKASIDPKEEIRKTVDFLKAYLRKHSFLKTYVLGISGGQDSTLAGKLAQMAIAELREETGDQAYQFIAVRLPYGVQADEADAQKALVFIMPDQTLTINIKAAVDGQVEALQAAGVEISDFNKGNIKARQRMISQYAIAGQMAGAVIGTDHAAENITGFFTKFGDGGADILPLFRLNKRQGKALLQVLGADSALYEKVPTADLEDQKPGLADEVALGVTYQEIDDYLEGKLISEAAQATIEKWWHKGQHKRHLPITIFDDFWK